MRRLDIPIVRMLPFVLFIIIGIDLILCWNFISSKCFNLLHSNSVIYATALYFISLANSHYHCVWNRAMYLFLIFTPILNYIDAKLNMFSVKSYLWIITTLYALIAIITAYMAIRHFLPTLKRKINDDKR